MQHYSHCLSFKWKFFCVVKITGMKVLGKTWELSVVGKLNQAKSTTAPLN